MLVIQKLGRSALHAPPQLMAKVYADEADAEARAAAEARVVVEGDDVAGGRDVAKVQVMLGKEAAQASK